MNPQISKDLPSRGGRAGAPSRGGRAGAPSRGGRASAPRAARHLAIKSAMDK